MRVQLKTENKVLASFNYSSLTDIVLLLLIFFLLTSSFITQEGLQVNLPEAKQSQTAEPQRITVSLVADGRMFLNDALVENDKLASELQKLLKEPDKQVILLSSDKTVSLERAVFVIDQAKSVGASKFFISTTQPSTEGATEKAPQ